MARTSERLVAGVRLTNPGRVLYPDQGVTKQDLAEYYVAVAERILPHLRGRPVTLVRCPAGRQAECFYQRRAGRGTPSAVGRVAVPVDGKRESYLCVGSLGALVSLVQIGVLELHAWGSRADRLDRPDRLVLDLDPGEGVPWGEVVEGAIRVRDRLETLGLRSFVKTTGGKGLHVVAPVTRRREWDELKAFSRGVAEGLAREEPERFLATAAKADRGGRIYLDYLRNGWAATAVAPYSTRARPGAPVSLPVSWEELTAGIAPASLNVLTVPERMGQTPDPWVEMPTLRQGVTRAALSKVQGA